MITGTSSAFFKPRADLGEAMDGAEDGRRSRSRTPRRRPICWATVCPSTKPSAIISAPSCAWGWTDHKDILDYRGLYTGGLQLAGGLWGREADTVGMAYGYLDGADTGISNTNVAELYYRFAANDFLALTADIQYMADAYEDGEDIEGWIFGLRLVAEL